MLADVVEVANVGMAQRGNRARFAVKALPGLGAFGKMRRQNLDRNGAVEAHVAGTVHFTHAACTERRDNFVRTEFSPRSEPHALRVIIVPLKGLARLGPQKRPPSALDSSHRRDKTVASLT